MRNPLYLFLAFVFFSCTKEVSSDPTSGGLGGGDPTKLNSVIDVRLFDRINMDYPGLEKAKAFYEAEMYYDAAKAILDYYRLRTGVTNPNVSLMNVTATADDVLKANYALDNNRFFVNNYYEDPATNRPYSLTKEGVIDWSFEPQGSDNEYQRQLHRHQWFVPQAKVYRVSKDERHIQSWISVYRDWLKNSPIPENGTNTTTWWQLQVATRVLDQTQLFDYYKNSINFSPEWFSEFMVHFAEHADFLVKYPYSGGNILISQASALAFAGVLFPEFRNASTWMETGFQILGDELQNQFLEDGMHYELDFSYHISAIADFYEVMKLADANQHIVGNMAGNFTQHLNKATEVVKHFTYPHYFSPGNSYPYFVPGFNDTRQSSWTRNVLNRNYLRYTEMFPQDSELLYMASYGQRGTMPSVAPKVFAASGYYVLRNGWGRQSTMLILSNNYSENSMAVWSHNQPDNGTFELYHKGRNFFPDAGVYTYTGSGDNQDRLWYRQTRVHNTMTLGRANITDAKGKVLAVTSDGLTEIIATENQGYTNLKHRRYVFFVDKKFFVLVDEGIGNGTGEVNLNFNLCEGDTEVIINAHQNGAHTAFADGNNILVRTFADGALTTVPFAGKVSYTPGVQYDRKAYSVNMTKSSSQTARFITILYPSENAAAISTTATFTQPFRASGVDVQVIVDGVTYNLECNL